MIPSAKTKYDFSGFAVTIRSNLWSFLQHARPDIDAPGRVFPADQALIELDRDLRIRDPLHDTLGYFWVDAICIDQNNIEERNAQVPRMKDIYETAAKVIVWLGYEYDNSNIAMDAIEEFGKAAWFFDCNRDMMPDFRESVTPRVASALQSLAHRPWWERAWVAQEISTPSRHEIPASVWCGHRRIPWHYFGYAEWAFNQTFSETDFDMFFTQLHSTRTVFLTQLKQQRENLKDSTHSTALPLELSNLLSELRSSVATDDKDKVYAILALAPDGHHSDLRPDYSEAVSVGDAYKQVATYIIQRDFNLDIIGDCFQRNYKCPSWTPDWSVRFAPLPFPKLCLRSDGTLSAVYQASGDVTPKIIISQQQGTLIVQGIEIDEISEVSQSNVVEESSLVPVDQKPMLLSWSHFLFPNAKDSTYIAGGLMAEAVGHVLCADLSGTYYKFIERGTSARALAMNLLNRKNLPRHLAASGDIGTVVHNIIGQRCLIRTKKGYIGLASLMVKPEDKVCVLIGSQVPIVLRPSPAGWNVVSEAYVHGIMDGEALKIGTPVMTDFLLV
ncbi:hypothetical protein MANI_030392 [Metarhizium anisopliae]|nr:hypothetical protein MANI_030392 [Metarhizium anisopliae]